MRLQRLTGLEVEKIEKDYLETIKLINKLKEILGSKQLQMNIIKDELSDAKTTYNDERRTEIIPDEGEYNITDLIAEEDVVITISHKGYIKRSGIDTYRVQRRGGRGVSSMNTNDDDYVQHLFIASTHDQLLIFTSKGKVYGLKVYDIPEGSRSSKGKAIINLLQVESGEKISAYMSIREFSENQNVFMATKKGTVKKTALSDFKHIRVGGIRAIKIDDSDQLITCALTDNNMDVVLGTHKGKAIRFHERNVRVMGRNSYGVRGIKMDEDDYLIGMLVTKGTFTLLTVTEKGFAKRTYLEDYRITSRGGKGIINIKLDPNRGKVVSLKEVDNNDEIMIITKNGILIRTSVKEIPIVGRISKGVKGIRISDDDQVIDMTHIIPDDPKAIINPENSIDSNDQDADDQVNEDQATDDQNEKE